MNRKASFVVALGLFSGWLPVLGDSKPATVEQILSQYVEAVGGQAAVDHVTTRELEVNGHRGTKATLYWQAPNKVLRMKKKEREGFDGSTAWAETKRKKVQKLPHAVEEEMETDANPIRYVHLKQMYTELHAAPAETVDGSKMNVLVAPNHIGATKFFFDAGNHLLVRIEEFGINSAYYKHTIRFSDYKEMEGLKMPVHIERESEEPGAEKGDLKISRVKQNVELKEGIFNRPDIVAALGGGKR